MRAFNMHSIKRAARQEAWYGDSNNPFRKTTRRSSFPANLDSWSDEASRIDEASRSDTHVPRYDDTGRDEPLSRVQAGHSDIEVGDASTVSSPSDERENHQRIRRWTDYLRRQKIDWFQSKEREKVGLATHTSWEPDITELSWDPFGSLSEELSESGFLHPTVRDFHNEKKLRMESIQQPQDKGIGYRDPVVKTRITNLQNVDIHVFEVTTAGVQQMSPIYDLGILSKTCTTRPAESSTGRIFVIENFSPSMIEILNSAFDCGTSVFKDHLRRAGDDVALVLPSTSRLQSHVVIPYRRIYQPSDQKRYRESRNIRSSFSHGGLVTTEEHVTCWISPIVHGSWIALILCDPNPIQSGHCSSNEECMRSRFGTAMKSLSPRGLFDEPLRLIRALLQLVSKNWTDVLRDQEGYMLPGLKPQYTGATDVRLSEKESFGEYLKQTLGMLKTDLQVCQTLRGQFQTLRGKSPGLSFMLDSLTGDLDELLVDYEFLLAKASAQIEQNTSSIPVITAMIAVEDNRKAIQQANDVKALTTLATVYIPLSFVAGIFGMNVTQLNPNPLVNIPLWLYFAIALPITVASMLLVWYGQWILECMVLIRQRSHRAARLQLSDHGKHPLVKSKLANALVKTGNVLVGPVTPDVYHDNIVEVTE